MKGLWRLWASILCRIGETQVIHKSCLVVWCLAILDQIDSTPGFYHISMPFLPLFQITPYHLTSFTVRKAMKLSQNPFSAKHPLPLPQFLAYKKPDLSPFSLHSLKSIFSDIN